MFTERALRLDDAAVIRLRERAGGLVVAWVATGFDVLASRVVAGRIRPADMSAGADALATRAVRDGPQRLHRAGFCDGLRVARGTATGGGLRPPRRRARPSRARPGPARGRAREGTLECLRAARVAAGPGGGCGQLGGHQRRHPDALCICLDRNGFPAAVDGRGEEMGLDPGTVAADEIVRVRVLPAWLRIDARFGSVYRRRGDPALVAALDATRRRCSAAACRRPARRWRSTPRPRAAPSRGGPR